MLILFALTIPAISIPLWFLVLIICFIGWIFTVSIYEAKRDKGGYMDLSAIGHLFFSMVWLIVTLLLELIILFFSK